MDTITIENKDNFIYLFENCFTVKGAKRGCIFDIQRSIFDFVPNDLITFLEEGREKSLSDILDRLSPNDKTTIEEYITFLYEKEYIFFLTKKEKAFFPKINLEWNYSSHVSNLIIDFDENSTHDIPYIISMLDTVLCENIELRFFHEIGINDLSNVLDYFLDSNIKSIFVKCQAHKSMVDDDELLKIGKRHFRLMMLDIYNKDFKAEVKFNRYFNIKIHDYNISSNLHCGVISQNLFTLNIDLFTESKEYNNCLNRKMSIDVNGKIKNCPSMAKSYGNIEKTTLQEALNHPDFKQYWNITKDKIHVCKDCEFRYICTDCRAYIEQPEDIYSKPLKCGYNPYTTEWSEWSDNPLKQKAMTHYGLEVEVLQ